jgi:hypothetical protein
VFEDAHERATGEVRRDIMLERKRQADTVHRSAPRQ